jgi:hypothetical protein
MPYKVARTRLKRSLSAAAADTGTKYAKFGGRSLISFSVKMQRAFW